LDLIKSLLATKPFRYDLLTRLTALPGYLPTHAHFKVWIDGKSWTDKLQKAKGARLVPALLTRVGRPLSWVLVGPNALPNRISLVLGGRTLRYDAVSLEFIFLESAFGNEIAL
jgi:hypothetical protein